MEFNHSVHQNCNPAPAGALTEGACAAPGYRPPHRFARRGRLAGYRGLTLIQWLVCIALVLLVGAFSLPKWLEYRRVDQAVIDTLTIAEACRKYVRDTGEFPRTLDQLQQNPGVSGWRGPYLESLPRPPWGGTYVILPEAYKVAISPSVTSVPEKYRLGGIAEISAVYKEGASWW